MRSMLQVMTARSCRSWASFPPRCSLESRRRFWRRIAGARLCMSAHEHRFRACCCGAFGERSARPPETANDFAAAHTGSSSPLCSSTHLVYCHDSGDCRHLGQSNPWMGCCRTLRRSSGTRNRSAHHAELFHARNLARIDGTCRRSGLRIAPRPGSPAACNSVSC